MILIADSGSTKTNWALIQNKEVVNIIKTDGINPFFRDLEDISDELEKVLVPQIYGKVTKVFFYGAGIINNVKGAGVKRLLQDFFPEATIAAYSDLLAAARATLGKQKGIACILGTGTNSCVYDGEKIIDHVSPLGFILGDEGSGAVMGRKLLGDYLKKVMPEVLRNKFKAEYNLSGTEIMERVYRKERANLFLAGFTKFIYDNIETEYCTDFVLAEFNAFVDRNLLNYEAVNSYPICFIGSVAFYFQQILKEVLNSRSLICGTIIKDPMEGLIQYHKNLGN